MRASEVMTTGVITVGPSTLVQDVVMTLLSNRISAVPVVDHHGAIIGIISEADLIRRVEIGTEKRSKWRELVTGRKQEFLKSQGVRAADVMTKPVVTATPQMPLGELVSLFDKYRIKRLPVVDGERIIGIVSRANLLQALALAHKALGHEGVGEAA